MEPNLRCPDCAHSAATKSTKIKLLFTNRSLLCGGCGATLKLGGGWSATILAHFLSTVLVAVFLVELLLSGWWLVVLTLLGGVALISLPLYFMEFKRIGTKKFHLDQ